MGNSPRREDGLGYFNLARGIGMSVIILGHSLIPFLSRPAPRHLFGEWGSVLGGGILVMFFMISGFGFYKRSVKKSFSIQKKLLLYPYWVVSAAILITKIVLAFVERRPFKDHGGELILTYLFGLNAEGGGKICGVPIESVGVCWFILALFGGWNIYNAIMQLQSEKLQNSLSIGCVILGYLLTIISKVWALCIPLALIAAGCLAAGHLIRKYHLLTRKLPIWCWGGMFLIVMVSMAFGNVNMVACIWRLGLIDVASTFCIGFFLMRLYDWFMKKEWKGKIAGALEEIGFHSIWIFCIHAYEKIIFPWYSLPAVFGEHIIMGALCSMTGRCIVIYVLYQGIGLIEKRRKKKKKKIVLEGKFDEK